MYENIINIKFATVLCLVYVHWSVMFQAIIVSINTAHTNSSGKTESSGFLTWSKLDFVDYDKSKGVCVWYNHKETQ